VIAVHAPSGRALATKVVKADDVASRNKGLLGRTAMTDDEGMWIVPCPMIHTFFMKFPIDVVFLDRGLQVRRVLENLKPWRLSPWVLSAHSVLELKGGVLKGSVKLGDRLEMKPS
jgi:uncharacterized membrane protein (UPF0127 family)